MRRLIIITLSTAALVSAISSPARAAGWQEYKDCLAATFNWCKAAREDANFLEEMAIDATCTLLLVGCAGELVPNSGEPKAT